MSADYFRLKTPNYTLIGDVQLTDHLQDNICSFLDWSLLGLGNFFSVYLNSNYPYGGNPSILRLSEDPRYIQGSVWEGFRQNWIWENNPDSNTQPINISGVWINNTFYPTGTTGQYAFNIAYPQGRVIFNNALPINSQVQVEYSYRYYNIYPANIQWFRNLMQGSLRLDDLQYSSYGSGNWSILPESRVQLPAVVVETVPNRSHVGKGLGGGSWIYQDVLLHCFAQTPTARNNILDILNYQYEKRFFMYDKNMCNRSGVYPLNQFGFLLNNNYNYPYLVNNFLYGASIIRETTSTPLNNESQCIYTATARWNMELDRGVLGV